MAPMSQEDQRALKAIKGVIAVAYSNFPADTMITVSAPGKNSATVALPAYLLDALLPKKD